MHKSHPLDTPLETSREPSDPLSPAVPPNANSPETHCRNSSGDADFPDKGSMGSSPRAVNKISCSFEGRSPRRSGARWGRKGKPPPLGSAGLRPRVPPTSAGAARGGREQAGAFRTRPLPRVPGSPSERRACPRVCSHLAGAGVRAELQCASGREVGAGGASASEADISSGRGGEPHPANGDMAKNVEDLNKTACLSPAAARQPGCPGARPSPAGAGGNHGRGLP